MNSFLCGSWRCADGFTATVITIQQSEAGYSVNATDENDGELAEVYDVKEDNGALRFCLHWASNGRFIKYRFFITDENVADVTFTYSTQETWIRSNT